MSVTVPLTDIFRTFRALATDHAVLSLSRERWELLMLQPSAVSESSSFEVVVAISVAVPPALTSITTQ